MVDLKPGIFAQSLHADANIAAAMVMDWHVPCCWLFAGLLYFLSNKVESRRATLVMGDCAFVAFVRRGGTR